MATEEASTSSGSLQLALDLAPDLVPLIRHCVDGSVSVTAVVSLIEAAVRSRGARAEPLSADGLGLAVRLAPRVAPLVQRCLDGTVSAAAVLAVLEGAARDLDRGALERPSPPALRRQAPRERPAPREASPFKWAAGEADRLTLHPIRHWDIWEMYKKLEGLNWTAQEVGLEKDKADWLRMTPDQRHFVKMQLAFFARVDIDVLNNLGANFSEEVDCLEARFFFAAQEAQECVHAEAYGLQIMAVIEGEEQAEVLNAVRTMPVVGAMRDWALRWSDRALPIGDRLVAFAAVEGVLFSSSFSALQWLRSLNLLPGITGFNTFIARDEGVHTLHTCLLVRKYLAEPPPSEQAHAIFAGVVELLDSFVGEALPVRLVGMNVELMRGYVRFQAECVLTEMGYPSLYRAPNPFRFMESLLLNDVLKINFFEHSGSQYQGVTEEGASRLAIDTSPVEV